MALTPNDSGGSQGQPVTFTSRAADRIVKAVRTVEAGHRDQLPFLQQGGPLSGGKTFRIATFTGAWSINGTNTVTLRGSTATLSAVNLFAAISTASGARNCAIAKDGTAWYLVAAQC